MFMRFVQLNFNPDSIEAFRDYYQKKVIPQLNHLPGCQFAGLIQNNASVEKFISVTLWENKSYAEAYEKSGLYQKFLNEQTPFFEEPFEWKIQLSKDLKIEYSPEQKEPDRKEHMIQEHAAKHLNNEADESSLFLRIVSAKIEKSKINELRSIYKNDIIPDLISKHGCRYAYLTQNLQDSAEFFSITIWDNRQLVERYESSGEFDKYVQKVRHTFNNIFRWQSSLEKSSGTTISSSADMSINHYQLLSGKRFVREDETSG